MEITPRGAAYPCLIVQNFPFVQVIGGANCIWCIRVFILGCSLVYFVLFHGKHRLCSSGYLCISGIIPTLMTRFSSHNALTSSMEAVSGGVGHGVTFVSKSPDGLDAFCITKSPSGSTFSAAKMFVIQELLFDIYTLLWPRSKLRRVKLATQVGLRTNAWRSRRKPLS